MKVPVFIRFAVLAVSLAVCGQVQAQTNGATEGGARPVQFTEEKINLIEENLVRDLESPIAGIMIGGAQTVREMKKAVPAHDFAKLIIPLMRIVKDEKGDRAARIISALALHEIESERGDFAISQEADKSGDEVFKSLCANLTKIRQLSKKK